MAHSIPAGVGFSLLALIFGSWIVLLLERLWRLRRVPKIRVGDSSVELHNLELSPGALQIPRGQVLAVAVDPAWPSPVQRVLLGPSKQAPNLAILLRSQLRREATHALRDLAFPSRFVGWNAWAVFATVEDIEAARQAFSSWEVIRALTEMDLVGRGPSAEDIRRVRIVTSAVWATIAFGILGFILALALGWY